MQSDNTNDSEDICKNVNRDNYQIQEIKKLVTIFEFEIIYLHFFVENLYFFFMTNVYDLIKNEVYARKCLSSKCVTRFPYTPEKVLSKLFHAYLLAQEKYLQT